LGGYHFHFPTPGIRHTESVVILSSSILSRYSTRSSDYLSPSVDVRDVVIVARKFFSI
jgi:hypothetical protein